MSIRVHYNDSPNPSCPLIGNHPLYRSCVGLTFHASTHQRNMPTDAQEVSFYRVRDETRFNTRTWKMFTSSFTRMVLVGTALKCPGLHKSNPLPGSSELGVVYGILLLLKFLVSVPVNRFTRHAFGHCFSAIICALIYRYRCSNENAQRHLTCHGRASTG
jgi:hypothetical protein